MWMTPNVTATTSSPFDYVANAAAGTPPNTFIAVTTPTFTAP